MVPLKGKKLIAAKFKALANKKTNNLETGYSAFIAYLCAGDPDFETSLAAMKSLPELGVDLIEIGVPFLDPSGDGLVIEMAAKRAIAKGMTLAKTLEMVAEFRKGQACAETPVILMSYFNPILHFGIEKFFAKASDCKVDGVLIVDLPIEEEKEIAKAAKNSDLAVIRLISPLTDENRMKKIAKNASGFLYLISMMGITGTKTALTSENQTILQKLKKITDLPVAVGFGIKTPEIAKSFAELGFDGIVVGSSLVSCLASDLPSEQKTAEFQKLVGDFAKSIKGNYKN